MRLAVIRIMMTLLEMKRKTTPTILEGERKLSRWPLPRIIDILHLGIKCFFELSHLSGIEVLMLL